SGPRRRFVATDFESFLDELAGTSEWKVFEAPLEGDPRVWLEDPQAPQLVGFWGRGSKAYRPTPEPKLTEHSRERLRALRAGSPRVEAYGPDTTKYGLIPPEHMALGWLYCRDRRRLTVLDREGRKMVVYYDTRILTGQQERVDAWVAAELEAGTTVKP